MISTESEAVLLEQLRAGQDTALEAMVRTYAGPMLASARRLLGQDEDARAAVQDAVLWALKALGSFDGQIPLRTWLHPFVLRAALQRLRTRDRKAERSPDELLPRFLDNGQQAHPASEWCLASNRASPPAEARQALREAVEELPEAYRTVLWLRDMEGLDADAAAQLLEINATLVKTRLHRARQALRSLLDRHFRGDSP